MLVVFLIVALALLLYINYKFNTLNKKIISLQSQLQRLSEQLASHQNNLAEKEPARAVDDSISPPYMSIGIYTNLLAASANSRSLSGG
ncbi:Uncharacterised protein [Psychrobacter phenylpyruvicus]|uniref:Uncharacterized protein n=1 Tax=Psychrobacter phenylpyruvicus TaxID=29432 RepID=A0A379LQ07_9GAMM|nr:Uncharacterised protein [Psychrobacter phenylpyruvicus]